MQKARHAIHVWFGCSGCLAIISPAKKLGLDDDVVVGGLFLGLFLGLGIFGRRQFPIVSLEFRNRFPFLIIIAKESKFALRDSYQLLVVRHPRYVVEQLVVVDRLRLEDLLRELVRSPRHQKVPWIQNDESN